MLQRQKTPRLPSSASSESPFTPSVSILRCDFHATRAKGLVCCFSYASFRLNNFPLACSTIHIFPPGIAVPPDDKQRRMGCNQVANLAIKFKTREQNTYRRLGNRDKTMSSANYQKWKHVGFSYERASPHRKSSFARAESFFTHRREF